MSVLVHLPGKWVNLKFPSAETPILENTEKTTPSKMSAFTVRVCAHAGIEHTVRPATFLGVKDAPPSVVIRKVDYLLFVISFSFDPTRPCDACRQQHEQFTSHTPRKQVVLLLTSLVSFHKDDGELIRGEAVVE